MLPFTVFVSYHFESSYFILLEIKILLLFEESASKSADNASGVSGSSAVRADCRVWWWCNTQCNVVSESVLTPRKPRLEADTAAFLRRLHRKQYLGISCYADMTVSNHCRDPGHCDHQSRVITIVTRAHQQGDLILRWVAANITQVSWVDGGRVKLCVVRKIFENDISTEPKDCITVQASYCYGCYVR